MELQSIFSKLMFSQLDYLVISINLLTLLSSKILVRWTANNRSEKELKKRVAALRLINLIILSVYLVAGLLDFKLGQKFTQLSLVLIVAFAINHMLQDWILSRFGTERDVNNKTVIVRSYTSGMIGFLALILVVSLSLIAILNIFELKSWLQASSFIGAFILILYASKDYLLADMISSLLIHYSRSIEPGNVIRVNELNVFGVVQQITLTQTTIRDLVQGFEITLSNSKLRGCVIENFSHINGNMKDYIDFKIGYDTPFDKISECLLDGWKSVSSKEPALDAIAPTIKVISHADHCVVWRMTYSINNPYRILDIKHQLNLKTLEICQSRGVLLNTPLTHVVLSS